MSLLGSPVKDKGLAVLPRLMALKSLSLASTDVTDEGMRHVAGLTRLERLDLTNTDVNDKGLEQLKVLTGLTELILDYSGRFTDAGFELAGKSQEPAAAGTAANPGDRQSHADSSRVH